MAFWGNITLWSEQMKTLLPATIAAAACVLLSSAGMAGQPGTSNGVNCGTTAFNTPGEGMGVQDRRSLPSPCSPPGGHSQFLFTQTPYRWWQQLSSNKQSEGDLSVRHRLLESADALIHGIDPAAPCSSAGAAGMIGQRGGEMIRPSLALA